MTARTSAATTTSRERLAVTGRVVAGTVGSYVLAALVAIATGTLLPVSANAAAIVSLLAGLLAMPVATMAVFRARSAARAWAGMLIAAALLASLALAGGWRP